MSVPPRPKHFAWLSVASLFLAALASAAFADNEASEARLKKDVTFLASDECEGRGVDTKGIQKAADYISKEFDKAGLKPGGAAGSWFQPFNISGGASTLAPGAALKLKGPQGQTIELKLGTDFQVMGFSGLGKLDAPVVFAGYGATAPRIKYDDYQGVDVAGKVVIILRRVPRYGNANVPFDGAARDEHAALVNKLENAEKHKAAAVLLVNDVSEVAKKDSLMKFSDLPSSAGTTAIPAFQVRRAAIDPIILSSVGSGLKEIETEIDHDLKPRSKALTGWTANLDVQVNRNLIACKNVIGVLEGKGPLANETVVIGAHYDHLGYGGFGSMAPKGTKAIHHGADDNGSGTTSVMELARRFAAIKDRQGRRLVFMTFSGEERGLLGSKFYCNKQPLFALSDTVAMVNLDMVGRLPPEGDKKDKLLVEGTGTAKEFDQLIEELNKKHKFAMVKKTGGTGPSDHDSFYRQKVPVFFLWTGLHSDYHRPSDTSDRINIQGMRKIVDLAENIIERLSTQEKRPEYVELKTTASPGPTKGARLGIQPNYEDEKEGVLVDAVTVGGAAAKAGLKAGDRIVEIAGMPVKDINVYTRIMASQRPGQLLEVTAVHEGKKMTFKVTPQ